MAAESEEMRLKMSEPFTGIGFEYQETKCFSTASNVAPILWVAGTFWKKLDEGGFLIELDADIYTPSAALKAAHELSAVYTIKVEKTDALVRLLVRYHGGTDISEAALSRILRIVTDYTLREQLNAETAPIRNTILAEAFGRTRLLRGE